MAESLEALLVDALGPIPAPSSRSPSRSKCPIPGCRKTVKRLWNHVFQHHKRENKYTGKFLLPVNIYT